MYGRMRYGPTFLELGLRQGARQLWGSISGTIEDLSAIVNTLSIKPSSLEI